MLVVAAAAALAFGTLLASAEPTTITSNVTFDGFDAELVETPAPDFSLMYHLDDLCYSASYVDLLDNDIGSIRASEASCCFNCKINDKCRAYTWNSYEGGTCWFKSTKAAAMRVNEDAVSSFTGRSAIHLTIPKCDMAGYDIGSARGANAASCLAPCKKYPGCRVASWSNYNGGTCWFKSRVANCVRTDGVSTVVLFR